MIKIFDCGVLLQNHVSAFHICKGSIFLLQADALVKIGVWHKEELAGSLRQNVYPRRVERFKPFAGYDLQSQVFVPHASFEKKTRIGNNAVPRHPVRQEDDAQSA